MDRAEATEALLLAKREQGLSYTELAEQVGADRAWLTAALLGQHPFDRQRAERLREVLALPQEIVPVLLEIPMRGGLAMPPPDPTIYRLYEALQVYGTTIKALINEDFGDGIMSAISFNLDVRRVESDAGPRVRIVLDGKFLPYSW